MAKRTFISKVLRALIFWERSSEIIPELINSKMRHAYGKQWTIRDTCLRNLNTQSEYCKTDEHFISTVGLSPTSFLIGLEKGEVRVTFSKNVACVITTTTLTTIMLPTFIRLQSTIFTHAVKAKDIVDIIEASVIQAEEYGVNQPI